MCNICLVQAEQNIGSRVHPFPFLPLPSHHRLLFVVFKLVPWNGYQGQMWWRVDGEEVREDISVRGSIMDVPEMVLIAVGVPVLVDLTTTVVETYAIVD